MHNGGGVNPANADYSLKLSLKVANGSPSPINTSTDYQITIPETFTITSAGWNPITEGITAKVSGDNYKFDSGYKLTVTASHNALTATGTTDTITYTLKTASDDKTETTSWEFSADELNASKDNVITGTTKPFGVYVEDYSNKPNGEYSDTVTFTAKVEDARQLYSFTLTGPYTGVTLVVEYYEGDTWNDMVAKYPDTIKVNSGQVAFGTDGFIYDKSLSMVPASAQIDPNETYEVQ